MKKIKTRVPILFALAASLLASCAVPVPAAPVAPKTETTVAAPAAPAGSAYLTLAPQPPVPAFQRNFNPFIPPNTFLTNNCVYETLMIPNYGTGELTPWLAEKFEFSADAKSLTFMLRDGLKWSDGKPLTAKDVVFSYNLAKQPGMFTPIAGAFDGPASYIASIEAKDEKTVVFNFTKPNAPAIYDLVRHFIVPEHLWKDVKDVPKYINENPVGSGPFTEVIDFKPQSFILGKNPNYWQAGKPYIAGVKVVAFPDPSKIALGMSAGELDWWFADVFPNPDETFVAADKDNRYYQEENGVGMLTLAISNAKKPFDDPNVRKAISTAINREQVIKIAGAGVGKVADLSFLGPLDTKWKVKDVNALGDWTTFNLDKANKMLDDAGLKMGSDGFRTDKDGKPMKFTFKFPGDMPPWVATSNVIAQNLKAVGLNIELVPIQFPQWIELRGTGDFDLFFNIVDPSLTPYGKYYPAMAGELLAPVGKPAPGNPTRYSGGKADALLKEFAAATDDAKQKELSLKLQEVFAQEAPTIPIVFLNGYALYNTKRFTGFPTKDNHYAYGNPGSGFFGEFLIVATTIKPK